MNVLSNPAASLVAPTTTQTIHIPPIYPLHSRLHTTSLQHTHPIVPTNTAIMHRTYSMRQSRAPTASQIQNPPPPSATTKSGRFFGKANIGMQPHMR